MADDWDQVTKIGAKTQGGGARATVARTQSELNAARRSGAVVATEKKVCRNRAPGWGARADKSRCSTLAVPTKSKVLRAKDSPRSTVRTKSLPLKRSI